MPTVAKYLVGSQTTLITTSGTQANNTLFRSTTFDNTVGQAGDGYEYCDLEFTGSYSVAPTANTGISVWFLLLQDGTNPEDGDGSGSGGSDVTPGRNPDATIGPLRAVTTSQKIAARDVRMPPGKFQALMKNDSTGQTLASGATLKLRPYTEEGV